MSVVAGFDFMIMRCYTFSLMGFNKDQSSSFAPRDEFQLCEFFEDLLLMRTEKFAPGAEGESKATEDRLKFSDRGLENLKRKNVINRIFRRWLQTNWGWDNWSRHFKGETPRQEISRLYNEFDAGESLLSVELSKRGDEWSIEPRIFFSQDLPQDQGFFLYGLHSSLRGTGEVFEPNFDPDFPDFQKRILKSEGVAKKLKSYSPPQSKEGTYWRLFWAQAGANLIFGSRLDLPKSDLLALSMEVQNYLDSMIASQTGSRDDFVSMDQVSHDLWNILSGYDSKLESHDEVVLKNEKDLFDKLNREDPKFLYSMVVFFNFGVVFDQTVLFPADRYFGGAEIVWTDHRNFLRSLLTTADLANKSFIFPDFTKDLSEGKYAEQIRTMAEENLDVMRVWFSPPTYFRFLPSVLEYF